MGLAESVRASLFGYFSSTRGFINPFLEDVSDYGESVNITLVCCFLDVSRKHQRRSFDNQKQGLWQILWESLCELVFNRSQLRWAVSQWYYMRLAVSVSVRLIA